MTAATIPRIRAADDPVRTGASLDGAEVEADEGIRVADEPAWLVLVISLKVNALLLELRVAVLKVEFRDMAVPVPDALPMLVMVAVELPKPVAVAVDEAELEVLLEPPVMVKSPE